MILLIVFLGGIGLLVQFFLCKDAGIKEFMPNILQSMGSFMLGTGIMFLICKMDYSHIGKWAKIYYLILIGIFAVVVLPILVIGLGPEYFRIRLQVWLHPFTMDTDHMYGRIIPGILAKNQWIGENVMIPDTKSYEFPACMK